MPYLSFWEKISVVAWKNVKVLWSFRYLLAIAIFAPSLFLSLLVSMRFCCRVHHRDVEIYQPIDMREEWIKITQRISSNQAKLASRGKFLHNCFLPQLIVAFAPNSSAYSDLMTSASTEYLNNIKLIGFNSDKELKASMKKEHFLAGVTFNHEKNFVTNPDFMGELFNLDFTLIFPSELRFFGDDFIGQSWRTNILNVPFNQLDQRNASQNTNYVGEGFISLQNAVSMTFISQIEEHKTFSTVKLNQFPRKAHVSDPLMNHLTYSVPFLIVVGYLSPLVRFCMRSVNEKLFQRKKIMRILGISRTIYNITAMFWCNLALVVASIFVLIIFKVSWADGFGIFTYSSWSALYFFLICYNIASTCFCFMASSLTKTVPNVLVVVAIFWLISYLPYMASNTSKAFGTMRMLLICVFSNSVMGLGFSKIVELEKNGEGLQWRNLFKKQVTKDNLSVGELICILLGLCIIYTFLGLSLHKIPILFIKMKRKLYTWKTKPETDGGISISIPTDARTASSASLIRKTQILEVQAEDKRVIIDVNNLTKEYHGKKVIEDVSVSIYEGEILVVMGHNGSGKTTLLMMIAGVIFPTSGRITIDGQSISKLLHNGVNIGIGVQNMLHPELTVADEIMLYSRLKGLKGNDAKADVEKYLSAMDLKSVSNVQTGNLTDGKKRHLTVCCALCGDSNLVVLDEPTTGMDSIAKRKFWDLILREKTNRTIIMSTHSPQEAEILGDHHLILSGGEVMCYGSAFFLKSLYGKGHRLVCIKTPNCNTSNVTAFLKNYIANITPESDIGIELAYRLQERHSAIFPKILADLEEAFYLLEISGCSISEPTIEDMVLLWGSEDSTEKERFRYSDVMKGLTIFAEEYKKYTFLQEYTAYKGFKLFIIHLYAMFLKRFRNCSHTVKVFFYILLPALVTLLTFLISDPQFGRLPLHPVTFRITQYPESVTTLSGVQTRYSSQQRYDLFADYFNDLPSLSIAHKVEIVNNNFVGYILGKQSSDVDFNKKYLVGVSLENEEVTAWFNSYLLHTAPLSLNLVHNALLASLQHNGRITVTHDPLPLNCIEDLPDLRTSTHIGNLLAITISYTICFIYSYVILFVISERETRFKLAQLISGIRHITFHLGALLYDVAKVILISLSVLIITLLYTVNIPDQGKSAVNCFLIMIVFGICITPFYYLLSLIFKSAAIGFWCISILNIFGVSAFVALVELIDSNRITQLELSTTSKVLSYLFPHFALCSSLTKVLSIREARFICLNKNIHIISVMLDECKSVPNCCIEPNEFEWTNWGVLPEMCYFMIIGLSSTILLFVYEFRAYIKVRLGFAIPMDNRDLFLEEYKRSHDDSNEYRNDIIREHVRVRNLKSADYPKIPLVMSNVSKFYGKKFSVSRVTLLIERGECFGLLGINASGKTTTLKMLVGDESLTSGRAYVHGISLLDDMLEVYKYIGYCPNFNTFPNYMTCRQMVEFFCFLRGIPLKCIGEMSESLGKVIGVKNNFDKLIFITSSGIKRRLTTAIALIGNPSLIYFDGHTVGIDPAGRRQIWNILSIMRKHGTTIMLTAHDPSDSERFCTRIGIINKGCMVCLDNVYNLQKKYIKAYILQLKLKTSKMPNESLEDISLSTSYQRLSISNQIIKLMQFMEYIFPNSTLTHNHGKYFSYMIPSENTSVSEIFKKVKRKQYFLNLENFSVTFETLTILLYDLVEKKIEIE